MNEYMLQLILNGLMVGGVYALISIGLTLIFGVLEIVNFAHGEFLMVSMYVAYWLFQLYGIDPYLSIIITLPTFYVIGLAVQRITIQPILDSPPLNQIFTTIGVSLILQNVALILFKADFRTVKTSYSNLTLNFGGLTVFNRGGRREEERQNI